MTHPKPTDAERLARIRRLIARKDCLSVTDASYLINSVPWLLKKLEQGCLFPAGVLK